MFPAKLRSAADIDDDSAAGVPPADDAALFFAAVVAASVSILRDFKACTERGVLCVARF